MTPISKELAAIINQEAADYSAVQYGDPAKMQGLREIAAFDNGVEDYTAGATAYAHYKERFEQAKRALEQIANAPTPYNLEEMWSWIHTARNLSDKALASWKEEGKGGGNG